MAASSYKGENCHALSNEQYFSKDRFLDICWYAFILPKLFNTKLKRLIPFHTDVELSQDSLFIYLFIHLFL